MYQLLQRCHRRVLNLPAPALLPVVAQIQPFFSPYTDSHTPSATSNPATTHSGSDLTNKLLHSGSDPTNKPNSTLKTESLSPLQVWSMSPGKVPAQSDVSQDPYPSCTNNLTENNKIDFLAPHAKAYLQPLNLSHKRVTAGVPPQLHDRFFHATPPLSKIPSSKASCPITKHQTNSSSSSPFSPWAYLKPQHLKPLHSQLNPLLMEKSDEDLIRKFSGMLVDRNSSKPITVSSQGSSGKDLSLCLVARVVTDKTVNDLAFSSSMIGYWNIDPTTDVQPLSKAHYLITCVSKSDFLWVLEEGP